MFRKAGFLLVTLFILCKLHAQQQTEDFLEKKYVDTSSLKKNTGFLLIQVNAQTPLVIRKKFESLALRKISSSLLIIKKDKFAPLLEEKKFVTFLPANNRWKFSPQAEKYNERLSDTVYRFAVQVSDTAFINDLFPRLFKKQDIYILPGQNIISLATSLAVINNYFLPDVRVTGIDILSKPVEELGTPGFDFSANNINSIDIKYPFLQGEGMHVSIKEDNYDTSDIDLKGRFDNSPLASKNVSNHANFIATIIAGAGNSVYYAKGLAPAAQISSSSFEQILPDPNVYYQQNNITVQNHSYGTIIDNNYGLNAVAFDKSANENPTLLHVFSSGNSGNTTSAGGNYSGVQYFANLTGNFKMAKNVITVGATDSLGNAVVLSSRGPAYDGRIKPDIAAFQKNGTSESAALVSGTALLMQQLYRAKTDSVLPSALAKAILINSADDVSQPGPDYVTGFGNLNAAKALDEINTEKYFSGSVSDGGEQVFNLTVPAGVSLLKVSLAWNDTAASPNAPVALVNDLDLTVTSPNSGETWKPWVLSSVPNADSLSAIAARKRDSLNNEEQVTIANPAAGNYQCKVKGFDVLSGIQKFFLAYDWDSSFSFKWKRFSKSDFAQSNNNEILRWTTSIPGRATIEFALPPFTSWQTISSNANLSQNYLYWHTPDTISQALIRAKAGDNIYYSDTFLITAFLKPTTGFICSDSVLLYWNKLKNIEKYQVYKLGEKYMEPLLQTNDTAVVVKQNTVTNKYIAVAPLLNDEEMAAKSYSFNYQQQGTGCYVNSFFADVTGNSASLQLFLGSLYNIKAVYIQKFAETGFTDLSAIIPDNSLNYQYKYNGLANGVSLFRAKIVLRDNKVVYSDTIKVYYNEPGKYLVFPVPVNKNQDVEIFTPIPSGETFILTDAMGRVLLRKQIQFVHEYIPAGKLPVAIYFYKIIKKDKSVSTGKIEVL